MLNVIDYMPGDTLLHKLNPVVKVALAASIIAATFLTNSYAMLVGLLAFTLLMGAYAGVAGRLVVLMKLLVPLALILFVLQVLFMRAGTPVFGFATDEGLITAARRAFACSAWRRRCCSCSWLLRLAILRTPASRSCIFRIAMRSRLPRHCVLCLFSRRK